MLATGLITGCQTARYYGQAISGQLDLLAKRKPVADLLTDAETPERLKSRLRFVTDLLEFARRDLLLPAAGQYRTYVNLDRPYVVWNVFAAAEFSLDPQTWCYPVVGCAAYRGYFDESQARRYADALAGEGYDVYVAGVQAYSTLGWFSDPILSTFIALPDPHLANLIFHELAHQVLYARDDTAFNESFATSVAHEGLRRWYASRGQPGVYQRYMTYYGLQGEMIELIGTYRRRLDELYRSDVPAAAKRSRKRALLEDLAREYDSRRSAAGALASFSHWFSPPLNNAKLGSIGAYHDAVPAFDRLLAQNHYDLELFYAHCRRLAAGDAQSRRNELQALMAP